MAVCCRLRHACLSTLSHRSNWLPGIGSGDRPVASPAYGVPHNGHGARFAETVSVFRQLMPQEERDIRFEPGNIQGVELLPESTHDLAGPQRLADKIRVWRAHIPDGGDLVRT